MANTFLHANGIAVGKSLAERDLADTAQKIMARAQETGCEIVLPVDAVVAKEFKAGAASNVHMIDTIPEDGMILDLGPASVERVKAAIGDSRTIVWNGPLGAFEIKPFDKGTVGAARYAAQRTQARAIVTVAGGGDYGLRAQPCGRGR